MVIAADATQKPIVVTGTTSADTSIYSGVVYIKFVHWLTPSTVGHEVQLQDNDGNDILNLYCDTASKSQWAPIWGKYNGIRSDNVDSGTLYIYIA